MATSTDSGGAGEQRKPSDPARPDRGPRTDDPRAFILSRTRSEVHLLLDNISASPDVTIGALAAQNPPDGLPEDWIEKVCEITWPPRRSQSDPEELAEQAALLIKIRDYLNGLAKPASGATIAFTLMVTQEENLRSRRLRAVHDMASSPSRSSLACEAYPDLVPKARKFRKLLAGIIWLPVGWLAFTLLISWYLAVGNAALADYAAARTRLAAAEARVSQAQSALVGRGAAGQANSTTEFDPTAETPAQTTLSADTCGEARTANAYASAELLDACMAREDAGETFQTVESGLDKWALAAGPDTASWLANLLGTAVLPVLYGVLGAIAAVVRSLSGKIKANLLSPRDVNLSVQQLALGAVIGACISLFIGQPTGTNGETTFLGPVALSSSAISFVAGFGVESVFEALEALISRIFNIAPAGASGRRDRSGP